jgi:hypothetical protein
MPLYANYDSDGTITSLVEIETVPEGAENFIVPLSGDHAVVELHLDKKTRDLDHAELVQRYRVDPESKKLVPRKG